MMKNLIIYQNELPSYRDFLWNGLRERYNLYLVDVSNNQIILPTLESENLKEYKFKDKIDFLVVNASTREIINNVKLRLKYKPTYMLAWTQYVGVNNNVLYRWFRYLYLSSMFKKVLLYYDHEKRKIPAEKNLKKFIGLNNTISNWSKKESYGKTNIREFVYIGRYTEKSNLIFLLKIFISISNVKLNIIGVESGEVPDEFRKRNIIYHGRIDNNEKIESICSTSTFFIYAGNVGLSIVHALKLGLIPIVHSSMDKHMPECKAVAEHFPILYFSQNDSIGLRNLIEFTGNLSINLKKKSISDKAFDLFSGKNMVENFYEALSID